jgi:hypothetical protein
MLETVIGYRNSKDQPKGSPAEPIIGFLVPELCRFAAVMSNIQK